jgi:uncharacterized phage infection (PIP) family protein YhgE
VVAKAKVRIEGEDATAAAWRSALGRAKSSADNFSKIWKASLVGIGFSSVTSAIVGVAKEAIELGDNLNKAAIKAGVSGKTISELAYAAKMADVELDSLSTALKKMQVSLSQAQTGGKAQIETLRAIGIEIEDIQDLKADEQFERIADGIASLGRAEDRTRALTELFGKAGAELAPLFEQGAAGIRKAREEADQLGLSFNDETLQRMAQFDDQIKSLSARFEGLAMNGLAKAYPALDRFMSRLEKAQERGVWNNAVGMATSPLAYMGSMFGMGEAEPEARRGGVGRPGGDVHKPPAAPGFSDVAGAAAAEKEYERLNDQFLSNYEQMTGAQIQLGEELRDEYVDNQVEIFKVGEELNERRKESEEELALWREQRAMASAQIMQDFFLSAYDNFVRNGKFQWNELLQYMLAQLARTQLAKALEGLFDGSDTGWFGQLIGAFTGAKPRAAGGPVSAGQTYLVGERGAEFFRPSTSGTIIPNHALGGAQVTIVNHNDFRGADSSMLPQIASMIRASEGRTKADVADGLRRGRYVING